MRAKVLAQNLAQRPWIWHLGEPGRPAFELLRTRSHSWPVRPVEVSIAISGRSFCGRHNAHQSDRTPNPPAAGRVSGVTGHEGLGYIKFTKKIKRCQKKWPFKRGGRPRGGRWWGVLLYLNTWVLNSVKMDLTYGLSHAINNHAQAIAINFWTFFFFFYPRLILAFRYCRCPSDNSSTVQARIKFGLEM